MDIFFQKNHPFCSIWVNFDYLFLLFCLVEYYHDGFGLLDTKYFFDERCSFLNGRRKSRRTKQTITTTTTMRVVVAPYSGLPWSSIIYVCVCVWTKQQSQLIKKKGEGKQASRKAGQAMQTVLLFFICMHIYACFSSCFSFTAKIIKADNNKNNNSSSSSRNDDGNKTTHDDATN